MRPKPEFFSILRTLAHHEVDDIIVGGVAILAVKEEVGRDKDQLGLLLLRHVLEETGKKPPPPG